MDESRGYKRYLSGEVPVPKTTKWRRMREMRAQARGDENHGTEQGTGVPDTEDSGHDIHTIPRDFDINNSDNVQGEF